MMSTKTAVAVISAMSIVGVADAGFVAADMNAGGAETGFANPWDGSNNIFIADALDLTYANYGITQTGTTNRVYAANTTSTDRMDSRNFSAAMSGEIWFSALVKVTSGSAFAGLSFDEDLEVGNKPASSYSHQLSELRILLTPSSLIVDMNGGNPPAASGGETGSFSADTTHLILGQMIVAAGNDSLNVWIDPDVNAAGGAGGVGAANFTSTTVDFMDSVSRVGVPISWNGSSSPHVDAIRVSDTNTAFVDVTGVVPEPGSLALLALGGLLVARRR